jgi:lipopolysaccharide export LptBFGC system permease protein LptF
LFAFPLALSFSVFIPLGTLLIQDELILVSFMRSMRSSLHKAVLILAAGATVIYIGLIFQWAPQSYLLGKRMLLMIAQDHLLQLEPNKFHTPFPGITLFFKQKMSEEKTKDTFFSQLFLILVKDKEHYFFTAEKGHIKNGILYLFNGSVHTIGKHRQYTASFQETDINFRHFFYTDRLEQHLQQLKFVTWKKLFDLQANSNEAFFELHKRFAQILWQFLMPFLALFFIMAFGKNKSNLLMSMVMSGLFYLISYVSIACAQSFYAIPWLVILILYMVPLCLGTLLYFVYRARF